MSASSVSAEAWQITKPGSIPDTLELRSITLPNLKPNQVLIKVSHAALNPADYKLAAILPTFIQKVPRTAASDFSGTVVKLGSDALAKKYEWLREENVAVWGLIFNLPPTSALGAMSTYTVAEVECIHPLPTNTAAIEAGVTAESAAGLGIVSLTAYLQAQYVKKGDRVFINGGTTAVGLIAADLAIAKGASLIVATASGSKADFIKKRGVNEVIDHRASDPKQELLSRYSSAPFDVVLDCIESLSYIWWALRANLPKCLGGHQRTLVFAGLSKYDLVEVNKLLVEGTIHPVVDKVFEWKDGVEAYKYLIEGRAVGKVVVAVP
ncbi:unnamed protein product [Tilletia controversa]|nr:unnamed protein product [Tilletia controversa]